MPVPERFRSSFSHSTLQTIETHGARFRVSEPLFFRSAYTANVVENERRSFAPVVVLDGKVSSARCTCVPSMRPDDLCRHIAALVARLGARLPSEECESSFWRSVAFASFSDGRQIAAQDDGDPREQLLRKYVLTPQEQALLRRGAGSARLLFEASPWYRWSREMFRRTNGSGGQALLPVLRRADEERDRQECLSSTSTFFLDAAGERIALSCAAVEGVVLNAPDLVRASGFEIVPESLTPSLRIALTRQLTLRFTPVLLGLGGVVYERSALPQFGRYFLAGTRFATLAPARAMFAEKAKGEQTSLFETGRAAGLPYDRETIIAEEQVFAFLERHREELAAMPPSLAPENVRNAQPVRLGGEVTFDHVSISTATSRPAINGSGFCSRTASARSSATTWGSARRIRRSR